MLVSEYTNMYTPFLHYAAHHYAPDKVHKEKKMYWYKKGLKPEMLPHMVQCHTLKDMIDTSIELEVTFEKLESREGQ